MRLLDLELDNFMSYQGHHRFNLDRQGLVVIWGDNGAGKSSLLDAIRWGIHGETGIRRETSGAPSGLKTDAVINDAVGKGCVVAVRWQTNGGDTYRVTRWRGAKSAKDARPKSSGVRLERQEGEGWSTVADLDAANVQDEINRAFGMDYKLSSQLIIRSQEDPYNFAQATPKERFAILTQIEGLGELDDVEAAARAKARELLTKIAPLETDAEAKRRTADMLDEEDHDAKARDWEGARAARLATANQTLKAHNDAGPPAVADKSELEATLAAIDAELAALTQPQAPEHMDGWKEHLTRLTAEGMAARSAYDECVARIGKLSTNGAGQCDECGQPVSPDHIEQHRGVLERQASDLQARVIQLREEARKAQAVIREAEASMAAHAQQLQARRREIEARRRDVAQEIHAIQMAEREVAFYDETAQRLADDVAKIAAEVNPHEGYAQKMRERAEGLRQEAAAVAEQIAAMTAEAKILEWWIRHIPTMKAWIFDNVVAEITEAANKWLRYWMAGSCFVQVESTTTTATGESRDKIGLRCFKWRSDGSCQERPFRQWSGGEKDRITKALDWALGDRLARRSDISCSFLALDEVDKHLDAEGRTGLLSALKELKRDRETVLVVTHSDLKYTPDHDWHVVKRDDSSEIIVDFKEKEQEPPVVEKKPKRKKAAAKKKPAAKRRKKQ